MLSTDFRRCRRSLSEQLLDRTADLTVVFKGEWIPPALIRAIDHRTVLWFAEYLGGPWDVDYLAYKNRAILKYNCCAFDVVFLHDPQALRVCRQLGAKIVRWLPTLAVDIRRFRKLNVEKQYDVVFIGGRTERRSRIVEELRKQFEVHWLRVWKPENLNLAFNKTKIVLNIHAADVLNLETRIGEVLGSGAFLLSDITSAPRMFVDGKHLVYWRFGDVDDLITKVRYYLEHDEEREQIAANGYAFARENHSIDQRVQQLLTLAFASAFTSVECLGADFADTQTTGDMKFAAKHALTTMRADAWAMYARTRVWLRTLTREGMNTSTRSVES